MSYVYTHGAGTAEAPYQVWTAADLDGVRDHLSAYFIQMADVDLGAALWIPIGEYYTESPFTGTFTNPNKHIVEGLSHSLFGVVREATISDVVGKGTIAQEDTVGGLFQEICASDVQRCCFIGDVAGTEEYSFYVGGFAGIISDSWWDGGVSYSAPCTVKKCYVVGNVTVPAYEWAFSIGGFAGMKWTGAVSHPAEPIVTEGVFVEDCYVIGNVDGGICEFGVGGFFGVTVDYTDANPAVTKGHAKNCYSVGTVIGGAVSVGGFSGHHDSDDYSTEFINCYYDTTVSGRSDTGRGEPRTTEQMVYPYVDTHLDGTYVGWLFEDIWWHDCAHELNSGYPQFEETNCGEDIVLQLDLFTDIYNAEARRSWIPHRGIDALCWLINEEGDLIYGNSEGYVMVMGRGWQDDGAAIMSKYTTKAFGEKYAYRFRRFRIRLKQYTGNLTFKYRVDQGTWVSATINMANTPLNEGQAIYRDVYANAIGESVQMMLEHNANGAFEIESIEVEAYARKVRA